MKVTRRFALAMASLAVTASTSLLAQPAYPSKPITIVVSFPAGGDTDVLARLLADKLSTRLGQPVLVDNRTGAGGTIGTAYVSKARPDGYTLLLAPNTVGITPHVIDGPTAQVHPSQDLTPIIQLASQQLFVVVATSTGITSVKGLVESVKAGKIKSYASPGNGSPMHILAEVFDKAAGIKIAQIPYRGSVPAVADMIGGHVPMMFASLGPVLPHIQAGKLVALAVADPKRSPFMPQVPTLAEAGLPGVEVGAWQALMGPKDLPADIVQLLNRHCEDILRMPDVMAKMRASAMEPAGGTPAQMSGLARSDYERYGKLVKEFGIRAE